MEYAGLLDVVNEVDLFALHHVFLPVLNYRIQQFQDSYIHHKLRTEHNQTPIQLWTRGVCEGFPIDHINEVI